MKQFFRFMAFLFLAVNLCGVGHAQKAELAVQLGHPNSIQDAVYSERDNCVVSASSSEVILWDRETGSQIKKIKFPDTSTITQLLTGQSQVLLNDGLFDYNTGKMVWQFPATKNVGHIHKAVISPKGNMVAAMSMGKKDSHISIYDVAKRKYTRRLPPKFSQYELGAASPFFSSDGTLLAVNISENSTRIYNVNTGKEIANIGGYTFRLAFSPDGNSLALSGKTSVRIWNWRSKQIFALELNKNDRAFGVTFSPNGRFLAVAANDIQVWDLEKKTAVSSELGNKYRFHFVRFAKDGHHILGALPFSMEMQECDTQTAKLLQTYEGSAKSPKQLEFSSDGRFLLSDAGLWDLEKGNLSVPLDATATTFEGTQNQFWVGEYDGQIYVVSSEGDIIRSGRPHPAWINTISSSRDGKKILVTYQDLTVLILDENLGIQQRLDLTEAENIRKSGLKDYFLSGWISPDGRYIVVGGSYCPLTLWSLNQKEPIKEYGSEFSPSWAVAFTPDSRSFAFTNGGVMEDHVVVAGTSNGEVSYAFTISGRRDELATYSTAISITNDGKKLITDSGAVWDLKEKKLVSSLLFKSEATASKAVAVNPAGNIVAVANEEGDIQLWDLASRKLLASLLAFQNGTWAAVDASSRFEGSNQGNVKGMHWVRGLEVIELNQLRDGYYTPDLLAKIENGDVLPPVQEVQEFNPPLVDFNPPTKGQNSFEVRLTNRGKGLGPVEVLLNGQLIMADARPKTFDGMQKTAKFLVSIPANLFAAGKLNKIEIRAYPINLGGYKGVTREILASGAIDTNPPKLFLIAAGVSDYNGGQLQLRFAAKDARDMARGLYLGASNLLGAENVHVTLLSSDTRPVPDLPVAVKAATRGNFEKAFEEVRAKAGDKDIIMVYLSGHGFSYKGEQGVSTYAYLTQEATTGDLVGSPRLAQWSISDADLLGWVNCKAQKKVIILDTCAAGALMQAGGRADDDQLKAISRLNSRTGFHILMGCAGNKLSYEATQYGQGLLTYALIEGMKGARLRNEKLLDIGPWFDYARERVPKLAQQIGLNIQEPQKSVPVSERANDTFDVGSYEQLQKQKLTLQTPIPLLLPPNFIDLAEAVDSLQLTEAVRAELRRRQLQDARGVAPKAWLLESEGFLGGVRPSGTYEVNGQKVIVRLVLRRESGEKKEKLGETKIEVARKDIPLLSVKVADAVESMLQGIVPAP